MAFKRINDIEILTSNKLSIEEKVSIFEEKYANKIAIIKYMSEKTHRYFDLKKEIQEWSNKNPNNKELLSDPSKAIDYFGDMLSGYLKDLGYILYSDSPMEIQAENYIEYCMMVSGKSDSELLVMQMQSFRYLDGPITEEYLQVFDSLNVLEGYVFDVESDEVIFTPEQRTIISSTIKTIREALEDKDVELAKLRLVSLQMLMNLDVKFLPTLKLIIEKRLLLSDFVDYDKGNSLTDGRSKRL